MLHLVSHGHAGSPREPSSARSVSAPREASIWLAPLLASWAIHMVGALWLHQVASAGCPSRWAHRVKHPTSPAGRPRLTPRAIPPAPPGRRPPPVREQDLADVVAGLQLPVGRRGLARGWRACTIGRTRPEAISGQTCSRTAATIVAFSAAGRARSVVAMTAARLASRAAMSSSPRVPPCMPMMTSRPLVARAATLRDRYFAPTMSRMTSAPCPSVAADALDEVLLAVVHEHLGAELAARLELRRRPGGHDDVRPDLPGELDRHRADAARPAVHQQRLAGLEVRHEEDVRPDRADDLGQRRRVHQRHAVGHRQQLPGGHAHLLGVAPAREQRAHLVADRPARPRPRRAPPRRR